ncbi:eukaryotic translation initiation factor 4G isoform X1 [Ricinus communis]|uniref:eukaryotic translation initiation factor 4G isoform X1 n=1 Tax=Ricinus communis TaxID=3988 RepID=UPI00201AE85A|nr:eukaryotic translation initiation factor 4G isoform X1 [Ricinus communis]XP_015579241.2 eukaryotic translation initiation factor 4G isoform X1 [Ricinus communis]
MSFNQSRSDKNDSQYRKSGRSAASNQQRTSSVSYGKGGGGGPPAPSPSSSPLSSNRSFKKSNHAQGAQSRVNSSDSANATAHRNIQNGAHHVHPPLHATADASVSFGTARPVETPTTQRSTRTVPKAPTSQPASLTSETASSLPPSNNPGDVSKGFAFQFGSLAPAALNGMQIPARTSSAPPNLDEQKRDQARHETFRPVPSLPTPTPKQQLPRRDVSTVDQSNAGEAHPLPKVKKDVPVSMAPPVSQTQKSSVIPIPMTSMQMPFHQPPVSVQFGGPNPQMQPQGVPSTSLQLPMPMAALPMGNAPQVQQPMFVQGLHQPHQLPPQGIMHQGQGLSFTPQMGPQLPPQLGNLGIGITSQYTQQQGGKFGGPRKTTVKITDPKTHEELRLDKRMDTYADSGSSVLRSHPNVPPQSQPIPSFPPTHPINYYPNSYNPNNLFFQPSSSLPLTSGQIPSNSQQPRYNYSVSQSPQNVSFVNPSAVNSLPINKSGTSMHGMADPSNLEHARDVHNVISSASSGTVQVKVKPAASSTGDKAADLPSSNNSATVEKGVSSKPLRPSMEANTSQFEKDSVTVPESSLEHSKVGTESLALKSLPMASRQSVATPIDSGAINSSSSAQSEESLLTGTNTDSKRKDTLSRSNSIKDHQRKSGKKGYIQSHQVGGQPATVSGFSSHAVEQGTPANSGSNVLETETTVSSTSVNSDDLTESVQESVSAISAPTSDVSEAKIDDIGEHFTGVTPESSGARGIVDTAGVSIQAKVDDSSPQEVLKCESQGTKGHAEKGLPEVPQLVDDSSEISFEPITSKSGDLLNQSQIESALANTALSNEVPALEAMHEGLDESVTCHTENNRILDNEDITTSRSLDSEEVGKSQSDDTTALDASSSNSDSDANKEVSTMKFSASDPEVASVPTPDLSESTSKGEILENSGNGMVSLAVSSSKEKAVELTRSKSTTGSLRRKRKEILQKADAAGTTLDLYMAYKGPEEKKESAVPTEATESTSTSSNLKQEPADARQVDSNSSEKDVQNKAEPEDWEDAADISTPKLETSDNGEQGLGGIVQHGKDGSANTAKKYSRDFLLKFSEQCTDLPGRFEITADIADALMSVSVSHFAERESYPSPGRVVDRSNSGSRVDRWGSAIVDDDRWNKLPGPFGIGRDLRLDIGFGGNAGFRPGQGGNFGVLRNPRAQSPVQYTGGILAGPMQSLGPQAGMQRNSADADRWQRAASFQQRGLIPSPQTPLQMMHRAERKYEVGKVTDEEESKQRQLKAILNKLTPQNFEKLFEQVKAVNIDNAVTLTGVISQIFDKALMEPTFCEMYANFCHHLAGELPDFTEDNEKITFKRLLLNKCQEEFERGEREQEEANKADEEGETKQSEEEREEKRTKARRRMLGNIRLIGELYKKKMLTERIMHECIKKLLGQYQNPDEEDVEALCKLMSTIGEMIDHPKAKEHMDAYFDRMAKLSNNMKLSSRVRFMLKDAIDLRRNKWQQRRKVEGPKKIDEVHRDAAQERHHQSSRLSRNPVINPSPRRAPMDFGPRGSAPMGGFHGLPAQVRGYGTQDVRFEERQSYEARTLSVPLPRPLSDDSITLGPQGGLARGMSFRGPPAMAGGPIADISPSSGDRRMAAGLNGFSTVSERPAYSPREEFFPRYPDRFALPAAFDQSSGHERNMNYVNRDPRNQDRNFDRSHATSPPGRAQLPAFTQNIPSEKVWPEERLRDMSMAAIKEFYSARDEKEVALCIKELSASSFHPSMISLWVTDSFERKDMERDLLAKLLINLARSQDDRILTPSQLIKGFESVLTTLEDAVNDAPKAAEFLGRMLAKAVVENVIPLREIGQLLHEGGEEPGRLLEIGLAGDVLGSTLEMIRAEKGESVLNEICISSNLHLEDFRPPAPNRSRILERFI